MRRMIRSIALLLLVLIVFASGAAAGLFVDRGGLARAFQAASQTPASGPDLALLEEAWGTVQRVYVDRSALNPQNLTYGAIGGMVDALGDTGHSTFLSPEMVKEEQQQTEGQYEGIGAEVQEKDGNPVIVAPMDGSPAQKAGLLPGDIILKVDGKDTTDVPLEQVIQLIVGPAGTTVQVSVLTPATGVTRTLSLVRAEIAVQNVTWAMVPGTSIADVRLAGFSEGVTQDLQKALAEIQQQQAIGIILDMRSNPGGLLDEAVGTASQFLATGTVLLEKDAQGQTKAVAVEPGGKATTTPMVVLIDGGTASAAEIVAGALQDVHRATLVGETTFGTGTVLNEFPLSDGSALMLAVEEWLTPSGRVIWHKGIVPDQAVSLGTGNLPVAPDAVRGLSQSQFQASNDPQLKRALDLLQGQTNAK